MIEKATAAAGAMCVMDWNRTGARPIASRCRRVAVPAVWLSMPTCSPPPNCRRAVLRRCAPAMVHTPRLRRRQVLSTRALDGRSLYEMLKNRFTRLLMWMGLAAVATYLMDPERGQQRRKELSKQITQ